MDLFIQGMRRSGTTILHDALLADPEIRSFYEPLREEDVTEGGGSGAREGDAFAETQGDQGGVQARELPERSCGGVQLGQARATPRWKSTTGFRSTPGSSFATS